MANRRRANRAPAVGAESLLHRWLCRLSLPLPMLFYLVLVLSLVLDNRLDGRGLEYLADGAYADAALAGTLARAQSHGLIKGEPVPPLRDTLWRGILAAGVALGADTRTTALLVAMLAGLLVLAFSHRWASGILAEPAYVLLGTGMVVLAPGFVTDAVSGTSRPLATLLVMIAGCLQVRAARARKTVLPVSAFLPVALASWLRIEYVLVWPVLCVHALFLALVTDPPNKSGLRLLVRMMLGGLGIALCLLPLLALNWWILQVPWPRDVGVPLSLDLWWLAPREVLPAYLASVQTGIAAAQQALLGIGLFQVAGGRWLICLGILALGILSLYRVDVRAHLAILVLLVLLPLFYTLLGPHVGWEAGPHLFNALSPLCALTATLGVMSWPRMLEPSFARKWGQPHGRTIAYLLALGAGLLFVLYGSVFTAIDLREWNQALVARESARQALSRTLGTYPTNNLSVVTDEPGWLAYRHNMVSLDLTGEFSPSMLRLVERDGRLSGERLNELLRSERPDLFILWNRDYEPLVPVGGITPAAWSPAPEAGNGAPLVRQVKWPAGS